MTIRGFHRQAITALVVGSSVFAVGIATAPAAIAATQSTAIIQGTANLVGQACATAALSSCVSVGYDGDGNAVVVPSSDVAEPVPGLVYLKGIACPSASTCLAISQTAIVPVSPSGVLSTPTAVTSVNMNSLACAPGGGRCIAIGTKATGPSPAPTVILPISTTGQPDTPITLKGAFQLGSVTCPSAGLCVALGGTDDHSSVVMATITATGVTTTVLSSGSQLSLVGVSCASDSSCLAVGTDLATAGNDQGVAVPLDPADNTFGAPSVITSAGTFAHPTAISCPPGPACSVTLSVASPANHFAGAVEKISQASGAKLGAMRVDQTAALYAIDCPDGTDCLADGTTSADPIANPPYGAIATISS